MIPHSVYEEFKSKSLIGKKKNIKLPHIDQSSWDNTPGSGIPSYDSNKDKNAGISQIKKFNIKMVSSNLIYFQLLSLLNFKISKNDCINVV